MGWVGGKQINLADVGIAVTTRNATIAVQSLDDNPIDSSAALMISLGARSILDPSSNVRFRSEPVVGHLTIRAKEGLKLYKRDGETKKESEIPASYADGRYSIELNPNLGTYWLFMK